MTGRDIRVLLTPEELVIIEDALTYYRMCTEQDGPDEHPVKDIRRIERWIGHYVVDYEAKLPSAAKE